MRGMLLLEQKTTRGVSWNASVQRTACYASRQQARKVVVMKRLKIVVAPCITVVALATLFLTGWAGASAAVPTQHTHNTGSCGAWSQVASPSVGTSYNVLNGGAAISAQNVLAVGAYCNGNATSPLIAHWT